MATIDSLAPETLAHIFDLVAHSKGYPAAHGMVPGDFVTLCSAALVCRNWRDPAQRALFQNPTLHAEAKSVMWLQSEGRSRFGVRDAVVLLIITARTDVKSLPNLFATFEGLKSLDLVVTDHTDDFSLWGLLTAPTLSGPGYHLPKPEFLRDLLQSSSQSLTSLAFNSDLFNPHSTLLSTFPMVAGQLQHLSIALHRASAISPRILLPLDLCTSLQTLTVIMNYCPKATEAKDSFLALAAALPLQATFTSLVVLAQGGAAVPIPYLAVGALSSVLILPPFSNLDRIDYPHDELSQLRATKSGIAFLALCEGREIEVNGRQDLLSLMEA